MIHYSRTIVLSLAAFILVFGGSFAFARTASAQTWIDEGTDTSDFWCPVKDLSRAYSGIADCPTGIQAGQACSAQQHCRVNTAGGQNGNACYINTELYYCPAGQGGGSCQLQQTSPGGCTQTGNQWIVLNGSNYGDTQQSWGPQATSCLSQCEASGATFCSEQKFQDFQAGTSQYSCWSSANASTWTSHATTQTKDSDRNIITQTSYSSASNQPVYSCSAPTYACAAAPTASLSASPVSITTGQSSTLTYSCANATSATIDNGVGGVSASGGSVSVSPTANTTYTLTCASSNGSATSQATIAVTPPAISGSCSVSPASISTGGAATWTSSASGGTGSYTYSWTGTDGLTGTGSSASGTYGAPGTKTASVTITSGSQSSTIPCSNSLTVSAPAISGSCTVSPTSITTGQSATWSATAGGGTGSYTYSWSGTDGLSGTGSSVSPTYSSAGTKTASVTISSGGSSSSFTCANSLSVGAAPQADLTAGAVSPASATAGSATTFSATASNSGNATSGSFPILFQIQQNGSDIALLDSSYLAGLAAGGSAPGSVSYTFPSAGTYQIQACANYNTSWTAITGESNYRNNCGGWTTVTVGSAQSQTPAPTCSLSANPTNSVPSTLTWSSTNASTCTGGGFSTGNSTSGSASVSTAGSYTLSCTGAGGSCPTATVTVGNTCTNAPGTISAAPTRVKSGGTTTITWGGTGVSGSCSLQRNGAPFAGPVSASSCNVPTQNTPDTITKQTQYCVVCGTAAPVCTIVNVLPQFQEF